MRPLQMISLNPKGIIFSNNKASTIITDKLKNNPRKLLNVLTHMQLIICLQPTSKTKVRLMIC